MPMQITSTATIPFEKIYIDHVGPINPMSPEGHLYIFTCSCDLTKFAVAIPVKDCTAITTARVLVENICLQYGIPKEIVSDNGSAFISDVYKEITKLLKIKVILTAPYHPQSNAVERYHRSLGQYLKAYAEQEPENWHNYLKYATFAYNNSVHLATNFTPQSLLYGYEIKLPTSVTQNKPSYNYDSYKRELQIQLRKTQQMAREAIQKQKEKNKKYYDRATNEIQ